MKIIVSTFLCFTFLLSCAQKNNEKAENFNLNKIYEKVVKYNVKPEYWLFAHTSNCSYVITLDDMPIYTAYNDNGMKSLSIPLNNFILESKKHDIKVLILPKIDDNYNLNKVLGNDFSFDLKVTKVENKSEEIVFNKKINYSDQNESFKQIIFPFESIVPYKLQGWTNSVDLSKQDKEVLEKEVVDFYKEIIADYKNKNTQSIENKYYKRQFENAQSFYSYKKEDSDKLISEINKDVNKEQNLILENYKLVFYGNGKFVGLIRTDGEFFGKSALLGLTDEDFYIYSLPLHRPKEGVPLEVIR